MNVVYSCYCLLIVCNMFSKVHCMEIREFNISELKSWISLVTKYKFDFGWWRSDRNKLDLCWPIISMDYNFHMQSSHLERKPAVLVFIGTKRPPKYTTSAKFLCANSFQILLSLSQLFIARSRADNGTEATSLSARSQPVRYDWITYSLLLAAKSFAFAPVTSWFRWLHVRKFAVAKVETEKNAISLLEEKGKTFFDVHFLRKASMEMYMFVC